jgi:DNA primase
VARLPSGSDPADLAGRDPEALRQAVAKAEPFLQFRLGRVMRAGDKSTNENKVRLAEQAMVVINEHPDLNVRSLYAGQVASETGLNVADLQSLAKRRGPARIEPPRQPRRAERETAETVILALLVQQWDDTAEWLIEELFTDDVALSVFRALAETDGDFDQAMEIADPEARDMLERAAMLPTDANPAVEARNLIGAATRRALARLARTGDLARVAQIQDAKMLLAGLDEPGSETDSALSLLAWLAHDGTSNPA